MDSGTMTEAEGGDAVSAVVPGVLPPTAVELRSPEGVRVILLGTGEPADRHRHSFRF